MESGFGPLVVWNFKIPFTDIIIPITNTVTTTWLIMIVITITCILVTRNFEKIPKKVQNFVELLVDTINNLTKQTMGEDKVRFAPYMGTILIFMAIANTIGIIGLRPPTADLNTTLAFGLVTFCLIQYNAVKSKGVVKRLKGFTEPIFLFTPMNLISEITNPISLGFRLFGNIVGGLIIMNLFYGLLATLSTSLFGPNALPVFQLLLPLPFHGYFDIFAGLLQSFIFAMLTMVNVSMAMD
ncbi:F0F1 ATP synthase subunit A [Sedimentibacter sp. zth1]|uniref:F0F1 ATP synthase subunit A n=1 Tax=Sedimentibacter sp. zth1 TaxID=2816908 RepID=UPI001A91B685|nr:F0F1 ATP synthase subunit A [Sedimentibacter sp. zth1]QSX05047.1 F0F1 ATP synthase subunit A [Sedimentibacter sp. zth1]